MKLIIAGSRTFCCKETGHDSNPSPTCPQCVELAREIWRTLEQNHIHPTEVVSGSARGADKLGELFASLIGNVALKKFPAKWRVGGKVNMKAGFERNQEMAEYADSAVLFWDGKSKGTQDMRQRMKRLKKPCVVYNFVTGKIE